MPRYDPENPAHVDERQTNGALAKAQREADWRWLVSSAQGRRILAELYGMTGFVQPSYVPGDALGTAHNEGARKIGSYIHGAVTFAGDAQSLQALLVEVMSPPNVRRNATRSQSD